MVLTCVAMHLDGSILRALCLGADGKYHTSEMDLNNHYANIDGELRLRVPHTMRTAQRHRIRTALSHVGIV